CGVVAFRGRTRRTRRPGGALATAFAGAAVSRATASTTSGLDAATGIVGGALLARLPEDLADAFAFFGLGLGAFARLARQRGQQVGGDRLDRDLLLDVRLDVRQALRIALAGEADRVALGAQPRGAADAVHVILGIERQVVVVDVLHAVDVQAARG